MAAAFSVAFFAWGTGFYGPAVYLVALEQRNGWPVAEISAAITFYYLFAATLVFFAGRIFEAFGLRPTLIVGAVAMALGLFILSLADQFWQVFVAFGVMSLGWASMSGAALNFIVAPWFDRRRGFAVSLAFTGANTSGVIMAPLLILLVEQFGLAIAIWIVSAVMLLVMIPVVVVVLRPKQEGEHDRADPPQAARPAEGGRAKKPEPSFGFTRTLRQPAFLTIAIPFALVFTTMVGFLTHQVAYLSPILGTVSAGWAVSVTTAAAVIGRLATGLFVDRFDQRLMACTVFVVQIIALGLLAAAPSAAVIFIGCALFGVSLGNAAIVPGLLVQREFPKQHFIRVLSLIVAVYQFTYAFGPSLLGVLEQATDSYGAALIACILLDLLAAIIIVSPRLKVWRAGG
ncbi:MAG: MFS transporter [Pseudomonadota bacterium]